MNHVARVLGLLLLVGVVSLVGCLPIELSVSSDGKILIPRQEGFCSFDPAAGTIKKIYVPKTDKPAFGLFAPDGKSIVAISETKGGGMGTAFAVASVPLAGGEAKQIYKAGNLTYACLSADGTQLAVTRGADKKKPPMDETLAEVIVVDVAKASPKTLAGNVSKLVRWFPDSKSVLTFQISAKDKETSKYIGQLVRINIADGKGKPLASVLGGKEVFFDLSPDGKRVLFTASVAVKIGEKLPEKPKNTESKLFQLDVAGGAITQIGKEFRYAIFSPKGTKVLLGVSDGNDITLKVGQGDLKDLTTIAKKAVKSAGSGPSSADYYPSWLGEDAVIYLATTAVYGTQGKNLSLMSVGTDGKNAKSHQNAIDTGAAK